MHPQTSTVDFEIISIIKCGIKLFVHPQTSTVDFEIISIIKCGIKLLIHPQTSTVKPLKFGNG